MSAAAHRPDNRVFHYAMLGSIVLHGLLFTFSMKDASRRSAAAPAPIVARLVEPAPPKPEAPRVEEPRRPVVKRVPSPKAPAPKALPEPAPEAAPAEPAPAAPAVTGTAPAASAAPPPADAIDADDLARFRMQVIEAAMKFKRYPRAAQENNWVGRVDVRVTFRADGRASIVVVRSSGHEILDRQALDTITRALGPVPPALRGRAFALEIPVIYNLNDNPSG
jgi:TonB family protein